MNNCIRRHCCFCKHFYANKNEFDNYYLCGCNLHNKYISKIPDVTLVTSNLLWNAGIKYMREETVDE